MLPARIRRWHERAGRFSARSTRICKLCKIEIWPNIDYQIEDCVTKCARQIHEA